MGFEPTRVNLKPLYLMLKHKAAQYEKEVFHSYKENGAKRMSVQLLH